MSGLDRSLVSGLQIFADLGPAEIDAVLREARSIRVPKGSAVFEQGGEAHSFFVLLHGHLRVTRVTPSGGQVVMRYVAPGEIFGIAIAIGRDTYPATAYAAVDSVVLAWPSASWPRLSETYPALSAQTLHALGSRLQDAHQQVIEISTEEVEQRVASALLRLAKQSGRKVERGVEIDFPISRQDVAEMTGTTLHTVSRILSAWDDRGLVEGGRQRIVLRDTEALMALAGVDPAQSS